MVIIRDGLTLRINKPYIEFTPYGVAGQYLDSTYGYAVGLVAQVTKVRPLYQRSFTQLGEDWYNVDGSNIQLLMDSSVSGLLAPSGVASSNYLGVAQMAVTDLKLLSATPTQSGDVVRYGFSVQCYEKTGVGGAGGFLTLFHKSFVLSFPVTGTTLARVSANGTLTGENVISPLQVTVGKVNGVYQFGINNLMTDVKSWIWPSGSTLSFADWDATYTNSSNAQKVAIKDSWNRAFQNHADYVSERTTFTFTPPLGHHASSDGTLLSAFFVPIGMTQIASSLSQAVALAYAKIPAEQRSAYRDDLIFHAAPSPGTTSGGGGTPSVKVEVSPSSMLENASGLYTYTFTRSGGSTTNALRVYFTVSGSAVYNTDYSLSSFSGTGSLAGASSYIDIPAGSTTATVKLDPTADSVFEPDETITLSINSNANYSVGTPSSATATISNDDAAGQPDLASTGGTYTVNPTIVAKGGSLAVSANVTNQGQAASGIFVVRFYLSANTTITTADYYLGEMTVASLAAGALSGLNVSGLTVSSGVPAGDYYVGWILDADSQVAESYEDNNTGYVSSSRVTVTEPLPVVTLGVSPASVSEGSGVPLQYTFTRTGSTASALTVYFTCGGNAVYNNDYTQSGAATFDGASGTVVIGAGASSAVVEAYANADNIVESDETLALTLTSNAAYTRGSPLAASGTIINVARPDLAPYGTPSASLSTVQSGGSFTVAASMINSGTAASGACDVKFYLSTNTSISSADYLLGQTSVGALAANASVAIDTTVTVPESVPLGSYYVGWILDAGGAVTESNEGNNTAYITSPKITVVAAPQIVVEQPVGRALVDNQAKEIYLGGNNVGSSAMPVTFTLRNTGPASLTGLSVSKTGANSGDFSVNATGMSATVASGGSTAFTVTFTPSVLGKRVATLRVNSNDPNESPFDIKVYGTGGFPELLVNDSIAGRILKFDAVNGTAMGTFGAGGSFGISSVGAMTIGPDGHLYVGFGNGKIEVFDGQSGEFIKVFAQSSTSTSGFSGLGFAPDGNLYVGGVWVGSNDTVRKFNGTTGAVMGTVVTLASGQNSLGMTVGEDSCIYIGVGSTSTGVVKRCQLDGSSLIDFATGFDGNGPRTPVWGPDGHMYVTDLNLGLVRKINAGTGASMGTFADPPSNGNVASVFAPNGSLYVSGVWTDIIYKHNGSTGAAQGTFLSGIRAHGMLVRVVAPAPEIAVEQPAGTDISSGGGAVFAATQMGSSTSVTFTIKNRGSAPLTGLTITKTGANAGDFAVTTAPSAPVSGPTGSTTFVVKFTPLNGGVRTATLQIANNDGNENPFLINVSGTGLAPEIAVEQPPGTDLSSGGTCTFGSVGLGRNAGMTFTIRNTGPLIMTGVAATVDGANAGDFVITNSPAGTVAATVGSTTVTVKFAPAASGLRTATLHIASNDPDENPFNIVLTGTGVPVPDITVRSSEGGTPLVSGAAALNFYFVSRGGHSDAALYISNDGTAPLANISLSKDGSEAADFAFLNAPPSTLNVGESFTLWIRLTPSAANGRSSTLHIASNDSDETPFNVSLSGICMDYISNQSATGITSASATLSAAVTLPYAGEMFPSVYLIFMEYGVSLDSKITIPVQTLPAPGTFSVGMPTPSPLVPNTKYYYRFFALPTAAGFPEFGPDSSFTTLALPPGLSDPRVASISLTGQRLSVGVNPQGVATTVTFEYGPTADCAFAAGTRTFDAGIATDVSAQADIANVAPNAPLYYKVTAVNNGGTTVRTGSVMIAPEIALARSAPANEEILDGQSLNLGEVELYRSKQYSFTIRNTGNTGLTGIAVAKAGDPEGCFSFTPPLAGSLAPAEETTFSVTFAPRTVSDYAAVFQISSNDADEPIFDIAAKVRGVPSTGFAEIVKQPLPPGIVMAGEPVALSAVVAGARPLRCQWRKDGVNIPYATGLSYVIPQASLADAGVYALVVSNGDVGNVGVLSVEVPLVVLAAPALVVPVTMGGTAAFSIKAAAPKSYPVAYRWFGDGGVNLSNGTFIAGAGTGTLTWRKVSAFDVMFPVRCEVSSRAGDRAVEFTMVVPGDVPVIGSEAMPDGIVGGKYFWQIPTETDPVRMPSSFSATGLPAGLTLDAKTGVISGRPTVARAAAYPVTLGAANGVGKAAPVKTQVVIRPFPQNLVGAYVAPIQRMPLMNDNLGGRVDVTVSALGAFTGKATLGRAAYSFKGQLDLDTEDTSPHGVARFALPAKRGLPPVELSFDFDRSAGLLSYAAQFTEAEFVSQAFGWRQTWSTARPASAYAGYYTFGVSPQGLSLDASPVFYQGSGYGYGYGYGSFTISKTGTYVFAGKMADGEALGGGAFAGPNGELLVWQPMYAGKGSLVGTVTVDSHLAQDFQDNRLSNSDITWWRPYGVTPQRLPASGEIAAMDFIGGAYVPPDKNGLVMALPAPPVEGNTQVGFTWWEPTWPSPLVVTTKPGGIVVVPMPNLLKAGLSITPASGAFRGALTLVDANPLPLPALPRQWTRTFSYQGMLVSTDGGVLGLGYGLLPALPQPGSKTPITSTDLMSGAVLVTPVGTDGEN